MLFIFNIVQFEVVSVSVIWVVKYVVLVDSVGILFGVSGMFKSFLVLDFVLYSVYGMMWLGKKMKKGLVLFIVVEGGVGVWCCVKVWYLQCGLDWCGIEFYVLLMVVMLNMQCVCVILVVQVVGVILVLVIVDMMSQIFDGEENSVNEVVGYFCEFGNGFWVLWCCVVLVVYYSGYFVIE